MPAIPPKPHTKHNHACEKAKQADCKCPCRGAGHQNDLLERASTCSNHTAYADLQADLRSIFGGFHRSARDVTTHSRGARRVPSPNEIPHLRLTVGRGATWLETLLVDEALHAALLLLARRSLRLDDAERQAQGLYIAWVTQSAIDVVRSPWPSTSSVDAHVWCGIVSEYLASLSSPECAAPHPDNFADIRYPRKSKGRTPVSLEGVQKRGLRHLADTFEAHELLSRVRKIELLRLVGAATCPDLWSHSAAVRFCLDPFVRTESWPPESTTRVAVRPNFDQLRDRWSRKKNW
ncbi:hypothetical protein [Nocardiopsis sp. NPDC006938]|uniref:hypothetical protein n=1 Tax=Nocardiopsis sp. NPDC006938 TaxID=3364337 RepID=UPI0036862D86